MHASPAPLLGLPLPRRAVCIFSFGNGYQAIEIARSGFTDFSKCGLKSLDNPADFDSARGVSTGEADHVKELAFWRAAIKPGRPIAMGSIEGVPFDGFAT
jgi:hypothetical protein